MSAVLTAVPLTTHSLESLVVEWVDAKRAEDAANRRRIELEAAIIACTGEPEEGSQTHELADGSKLTVTAKITRTVDDAAWRSIMGDVPENLRPISIVETAKLDLKGLRWLMDHEPHLYAKVASAITAKRAKTAITLKVA